jgi:hypothetical protein
MHASIGRMYAVSFWHTVGSLSMSNANALSRNPKLPRHMEYHRRIARLWCLTNGIGGPNARGIARRLKPRAHATKPASAGSGTRRQSGPSSPAKPGGGDSNDQSAQADLVPGARDFSRRALRARFPACIPAMWSKLASHELPSRISSLIRYVQNPSDSVVSRWALWEHTSVGAAERRCQEICPRRFDG